MEPDKRELIESVFAGDSEMATRMRALDWSATPLGPVEEWPQALRTSVRFVLDSARAFEQERQPEIEKLRASEQKLAETSRLYREQQEAATKSCKSRLICCNNFQSQPGRSIRMERPIS